RANNQRNSQSDQLFPEPRDETLRREPILMFSAKIFVKFQRKCQEIHEQQVWDRVKRYLNRLQPRSAFREIAQGRRCSRGEKEDRDGDRQKKIPEDQPITALKIRVRFCAFVGRDGIQPRLCCRGGIERTRILGRDSRGRWRRRRWLRVRSVRQRDR